MSQAHTLRSTRRSLRCRRGRRWHQRCRDRRRRSRARPVRVPLRTARPGPAHLLGQQQADPRRPALPRTLRIPPGPRSPGRARGPAGQGAAHRQAAALRPAAPSAPAPGLDDPRRPVPLRSPRQAREAARLARPALHRQQPAEGRDPPWLRVLRLRGGRCAPGGAQRDLRPRARRPRPYPHPLRQRPSQQGTLAPAPGAQRRQPVFDPRPRPGERRRPLGGALHPGRPETEVALRYPPDPGQPHHRAEAVRRRARLHPAERRPPHRLRHPLSGPFHH